MERAGAPRLLKHLLVAGVGFTALLMGCNNRISVDTTEPSRVIATVFTPEYIEPYDTGMCMVRSEGVCILSIQGTRTVPDAFHLKLEQCETGALRSTEDEQCATTTVAVAQSEFEKVREGSVVKLDEHRAVTVIPQ